jgi:hypothetical protein
MTRLAFAPYEPIFQKETLKFQGANSASGPQTLTIRRNRVHAAFSAKANLTTVLNNPAIISHVLETEAVAAVLRIERREGEDPETWARLLGNDLGSFKD